MPAFKMRMMLSRPQEMHGPPVRAIAPPAPARPRSTRAVLMDPMVSRIHKDKGGGCGCGKK